MRRVLGRGDLLLIAAAAIGPAFSLATTLGPMLAAGGSATPLALVAITVVMTGIALGYRRLGARYPNAGSSYTWVRAAFGPVAGAYAAWILIVGNLFAIVATAVPAGTYTLALLYPAAGGPAGGAIVGTLWVLACGALLIAGLRPTARLANGLALAELVLLGAAAAVAFARPAVAGALAAAPPPGLAGFAGALVIGIWMTDGWEVSAATAEEAATPAAAPGSGGLAGLLVTGFVLYAATAAFARGGTADGFAAHQGDALAYVAGGLGGEGWRRAAAAVVLVSLAASLQATLVYLSRSFYAMGRDGLLPRALGALDRRDQPARAVILLTAIGALCTLASGLSPSLGAAFALILGGTSAFLGILFAISAAAAVRLFAGDPAARLDGVVAPAAATVVLVALLVLSLQAADAPTRLLIGGAGLAGLPLAWWRGRSARLAV